MQAHLQTLEFLLPLFILFCKNVRLVFIYLANQMNCESCALGPEWSRILGSHLESQGKNAMID